MTERAKDGGADPTSRTGVLEGVLDAAEAAFREGAVVWWGHGVSYEQPDAWFPDEIELARALVREGAALGCEVRAVWEERGVAGEADLVEFGSEATMVSPWASPGPLPTIREIYAAWVRPIDELIGSAHRRLAPSEALFWVEIELNAGFNTWSYAWHVAALTTEAAVLVATGDDVPGAEVPWYPIPVALINPRRLLYGVGAVLRELMGGVGFFRSPFDRIWTNQTATDLWRVFLYTSPEHNETIFDLDIPDLAAVEVEGAAWDYVDLVQGIDGPWMPNR